MPQSLTRILVHIVFSTKGRRPWLQDKQVRTDLHAYLASICQQHECPAIIVNGVEDHVHLLCVLSRKIALMDLIEHLKTSSSKVMKTKGAFYHDFYWQSGYGAFSVSPSKEDDVKGYIERQEDHHRKVGFQDEYRELCVKHAVPLDERYVWD
jgi:putative transposase